MDTSTKQQKLSNGAIKKISKFIASRMFYLLIGLFLAITISVVYAAVTYPLPNVGSGDTLTSAAWNNVVDDINDLNSRVNTLEGSVGWPAGSYCIFMGGGSCPTGFTPKTGHMRAIALYAANSSYIVPVTFGNSNIRCHGTCGQYGNWIGELNLNICCK